MPEFLVRQINQKPLQNYFDRAAEDSHTKSVKHLILEEAKIGMPSILNKITLLPVDYAVKNQSVVSSEEHNAMA